MLRPAQVGPGHAPQLFPNGTVVQGQVSLDLCGFTFRSEALRTARVQMAYLKPRAAVQVSNEVVTYRRDGARKALAELRQAVRSCPREAVSGPAAGVGPIRYRVTRIRAMRLLPGALALEVRIVGRINARPVDLRATFVYQVRGSVLSAVYTYGGAPEVRRRLALRAAAASAKNLRKGPRTALES